MATPVVTPYVLMKALQDARRKGAPSDPYGIATAIRSMGGDYDAMNKSIIGSNQAQVSNAETEAKLNAGFFPAQVAEKMAGFAKKTYDDTNHLSMKQAVEEAHAAAVALDLKVNTPEYQLFMRDQLSKSKSYDAAAVGGKLGQAGIQSLQAAQVGTANIKQNIESTIAAKFATEYFKEQAPGRLMGPGVSEQQRKAIANQLWQEAIEKAQQRVDDEELVVDFDQNNGLYTATDGKGRVVPIPDNFLAPNYGAMGNTGMAKLESQFKASFDALRNRLAGKGVYSEGETTKGATPKAPPKTTPDPRVAHLHKLESQYWTLASKPADVVDQTKLAEFKKRIDSLEKELSVNSVSMGVPAAASVPMGEVPGMMYGSPAAPNLGLIPDDLQGLAPTPEPDLLGIPPMFSGFRAL